jgi:hypothetical protein
MSARVTDSNGWCEVKRNPLAKAGVFDYRGSSIGAARQGRDPNAMYKVYRPASELSSIATLDSLKLIPWIDDHAMLGDPETNGYVDAAEKGVKGVIGENITFDSSTNTLYGNIKCFSAKHQKLIDAGKKQLSLGYRCKYDWTPGTFNGETYDCIQRSIRFNHNASTQQGRMGPDVAVLDSVDEILTVTFDAKDFQIMAYNKDRVAVLVARATGKLGDKVVDVATMDATEAALDKVGPVTLEDMTQALKEIAAVKPVFSFDSAEFKAAVQGAVDTAVAGIKPVETKTVETKIVETGMDAAAIGKAISDGIAEGLKPMQAKLDAINPKAIFAEGAARDTLANRLSGFMGTFDHADMSLSDVVKKGLEHFKLEAPSGSELPVLNAYLTGRKPVHETGMDSSATRKPSKQVDALLEDKAA